LRLECGFDFSASRETSRQRDDPKRLSALISGVLGAKFLLALLCISNSLNRLVLGAVAPVASLGVYAGAERITRVFIQGLWPVNLALYPRLNRQMQNNPSMP
jgi:O-antigen/teichoic acid export membrane protein